MYMYMYSSERVHRVACLLSCRFRDLLTTYLNERFYLQRLRIVKLAMLCARTQREGRHSAANTPTLGAVLAAWKLLRSDDGKAQAASLEVVESALSGSLAGLVSAPRSSTRTLPRPLALVCAPSEHVEHTSC